MKYDKSNIEKMIYNNISNSWNSMYSLQELVKLNPTCKMVEFDGCYYALLTTDQMKQYNTCMLITLALDGFVVNGLYKYNDHIENIKELDTVNILFALLSFGLSNIYNLNYKSIVATKCKNNLTEIKLYK